MKNTNVVNLVQNTPEELWKQEYDKHLPDEKPIKNRSGITIKPLYTPSDWDESQYEDKLGYPGQLPMTRGIYPTMHRGRVWSQRQLIGFGTPEDYNKTTSEAARCRYHRHQPYSVQFSLPRIRY